MKDTGIYVKMSQGELDAARIRAKRDGKALSALIRELLSDGEVIPDDPDDVVPEKAPRRPRKPEVSEPLTVASCVCGDLASKHVNGVCSLCKCSRLVIA